MKTTTVRVSMEGKQRLDRLQARLVLMTGQAIRKEEVLDRLLAHGERNPGHVFDEMLEPPSAERIARIMALPVSTGRRTREEDIDRDLYGA